MKPKFKSVLAWEQAQLLMQPAFIRVIDNIRKQLEQSSWRGTYEEITTPYPGYLLCLTRNTNSVEVNIWELCFQICFLNYQTMFFHEVKGSPAVRRRGLFDQDQTTQEVEVDASLIDETGEVDWQRLETKAKAVVREVFARLPSEDS